MKNIKNKLIVIIIIVLAFPFISFAQSSFTTNLSFEVNRIISPLTITKDSIQKAKSLSDLDRFYKRSWIKEFLSVEVLTTQNGKLKKTISKDDHLTQKQKDVINNSDKGSDVKIKVRYIPENNLKQNPPREMDFSFQVAPIEAKYSGGQDQLEKYLKENTIDKISANSIKEYNLTAVKFTVNKDGQIVNPHIVETSKDEKVDNLLVQAISNMSNWNPAEYADGTKTAQDFVLSVGDHRSCTLNLLNIENNLTLRNK